MAIHETFYADEFRDVTGFYRQDDACGQVEFVKELVSLRPRDRILDLGCGFGRHSVLLAGQGLSVTGYDQSADYIERAERCAREKCVSARFRVMDMRELDTREQFDVILSLSTSLAFYDDDTNMDIFRRVCEALSPGGRFVYDQGNIFPMVSWITSGGGNTTDALPDGRVHHCRFSFDASRCVVSRRSTIEEDGNRRESGWDLRYYCLPEIRGIAAQIGLEIIKIRGDYDSSDYCVDSPRLIVAMAKH